jgi:Tol biopolymer transport system component
MTCSRRRSLLIVATLAASLGLVVPATPAVANGFPPPVIVSDDVASFETATDGSAIVYARRAGRTTVLMARALPDGPSRRLGRGVRSVDAAWGEGHRLVYRSSDFADVDARWARITPDSRRVVALRDGPSGRRLVSMALGRGKTFRLTGIRSLYSLRLSPDSSTVVFVGDLGRGDGVHLYSVGVTGGPVTALDRLHRLPVMQFSPDSQRIVYRTQGPSMEALRSVAVTGGPVTTLLDGIEVHDHIITPDGRTVFFTATDRPGAIWLDEYFLWRSPIDRSEPARVFPDPVGSVGLGFADAPVLTIDAAAEVLYFGDRAGSEQGIMALPLADDTPIVLAPTSGPLGQLRLSPDGRHLVEAPWGEPRLRFATIDIERRTRTVLEGIEPNTGHFAPDGSGIAFTDAQGRGSLWFLPFGGPAVRLATGYDSARFTSIGPRVVFVTGNDRQILRIADLDGARRRIIASVEQPHIAFAVTPGYDAVVYLSAAVRPSIDPATTGTLRLADVRPRCGGRVVTISGSPGRDVIMGTAGPDVIDAGSGNDVVRGGRGDDVICGGPGDDRLRGGPGDDVLLGGPGRDRCIGGPGSDRIRGC